MKRKLISISIICLVTLVTIYIFLTSKEIAELPHMVQMIDYKWLAVAVACILIYIIINTFIIYSISKELTDKLTVRGALYISFVGQYYSLITPFASGGQPAQIYAMNKKYDISVAKATTITVKKFIVYQVVVALFATMMFFIKLGMIVSYYSGIFVFIIIGLIINLFGGIGILLLAYRADAAKKMVLYVFKLIRKIGLFKKTKKEDLLSHIDDYMIHIKELRRNKSKMIEITILTLIQLVIYFSVTYFIYISLGQVGASYVDILAIQTIAYVVVSFIPTPGGVGASEGSFYILFRAFFAKDILLYGMVLWRLIGYYGMIMVSGFVVLIEYVRVIIRKRIDNRQIRESETKSREY